eukprot:Nitzschia sp. Nitz4//scaffold173_size47512//30225//31472//NITZ4_007162-RA/size47512-processed-gene-0.37-mRNA-1//-1//CDS//3329538814//7918//frame0
MSSTSGEKEKALSFSEIMDKASKSAIRGGTAGAVAMGANVACLMWMRTTCPTVMAISCLSTNFVTIKMTNLFFVDVFQINYQYRNGTTFPKALKTLYADGGIPRFYRGVIPALVQGPLSRFGDTAANTGVLTALDHMESTKDMNVGLKTAAASASAALFRIFLMPIDTVKTTMQVTGKFSAVADKVRLAGPLSLYNGAIAAASATFVGHYPWFLTYNFLSEQIPEQDGALAKLGRRALLGFCSSAVSDTCSNSIRVMKVYKQSYPEQITYVQVFRNVVQESGITGLMFRGLETKILANGMQGILFSILWKHFEEVLFPKH